MGEHAAKCMSQLKARVLDPLMKVLADQDTLLKTTEVPAAKDEVTQETAILFKSVWDGLDKIWKAYKQNHNSGWVLEDFAAMCNEFQMTQRVKPLVVHRIFYAHASPDPKRLGNVSALSFTKMLDSLVLIAEKVEQANVFQSTTGRVLALLHQMNEVCFRTRLAHLRPLFILPCIPETVVQERQPQGWRNMMSHAMDDD